MDKIGGLYPKGIRGNELKKEGNFQGIGKAKDTGQKQRENNGNIFAIPRCFLAVFPLISPVVFPVERNGLS
jgi:hypothetical protein